jgi:protein phosphatase-4 regulatory subunit 3
LNDNVIFELVLRDELILGVASILECKFSFAFVDSTISTHSALDSIDDPEFPTMKASYRAHLADSSHFTQVVPIRSPATLVKIHQTHRLYYLKDVVLARILEDSTFSMLNSAIYFNEVDIVNEIAGDEQFLHELFSIFDKDVGGGLVEKKMHEEDEIGPHPPRSVETIGPQLPIDMQGDQQNGSVVSRHFETPLTSTSSMVITNGHSTQLTLSESLAAADALINRQHDAILFIQQFCSMAKNLQLPLRAAFFRNLVSKGLLRVIEVALAKTRSEGDSLMRSATVGILMNLVDHDPNNVRGYSLQQHSLEKRPLVVFLVELFNKEPDLGLKAQMAEALRVLVDAGGEGGPLEVSSSSVTSVVMAY